MHEGSADDRARETDALFHTAAQVHRHLFLLPFELDNFEHFRNLLFDHPLIALARFAEREGDVFLHRHGVEESAALKENAHLAPNSRRDPARSAR